MSDLIKVAILDMNNGYPNQGLRCIREQVELFKHSVSDLTVVFEIFDVRQYNEVPNIEDYDIFISSGGPGSPLAQGDAWEVNYYAFLDAIRDHNIWNEQKKYLFLICHSFLMACDHWQLAEVNQRKSYSFGVMPIHKTEEGELEPLFEGLPEPFYAVDSRAFQVVQANEDKMKEFGAVILNIEKERPYIELERAIMAIRFSPEIFGTQYHPEADAEGMRRNFMLEERRNQLIETHGMDKYEWTMQQLDDDDKIMLTQQVILPKFLKLSAEKVAFKTYVS